ncbi:MAG: hypothetical protein V4507_06850 [Verrucomicrobiota bacterium]
MNANLLKPPLRLKGLFPREISAVLRVIVMGSGLILGLLMTSVFSQSTSTVPEGMITYTVAAGTISSPKLTTFSLPLTESAAFSGTVSGVTSNTLSAVNPGWRVSAYSSPDSPFGVRFTTGALTGETYLISTTTPSTVNTVTVTNDGGSLVNGAQVGDQFEIFPCDTLLSFFGSGTSTGDQAVLAGTRTTADEVSMVQNGTWTTYYFDSTAHQWRSGTLPFNCGNTVVSSDAGVVYNRRASTPYTFSVIGRVSGIDRQISYNTSGVSFIGTGFPKDLTLRELGLNLKIAGWINKVGSATSGFDQIGVYDGSVWNYYSFDGSSGQWRKGTLPFNMSNVVISVGNPILIQKSNGTLGVGTIQIPIPYSLN